MTILLTGGTGFIGNLLTKTLIQKGYKVILLTRNPEYIQQKRHLDVWLWDGVSLEKFSDKLQEVTIVINLAGQGVADKRWTESFKKVIWDSRVNATQSIISAIKAGWMSPRVVLSGSAIGFYEGNGEEKVDEASSSGDTFFANLTSAWEEKALEVQGTARVCLLRIGIVLEKDGGALKKLYLPFKWFVGGPVGSGNQWYSWIHREDVVRAICFCLDNKEIQGPVNLTAPKPERLSVFCKRLGKIMRRPSWIKIPGIFVTILLGEFAKSVLNGQHVEPKALLKNGFTFKYPYLTEALRAILKY